MRAMATPRTRNATKPNQKASCLWKKNVVSQTNPFFGLKTVLKAAVRTAIASAQAIAATQSSRGNLAADWHLSRSTCDGRNTDIGASKQISVRLSLMEHQHRPFCISRMSRVWDEFVQYFAVLFDSTGMSSAY